MRPHRTHPSDIYVRRQDGSRQWGVFLQRNMLNADLLEGGFFSHAAAMDACRRWRKDIAEQEAGGSCGKKSTT